jgi:hypothetical protein
MDDAAFDRAVRAAARGGSRRGVLRTLGLGLAAVGLGSRARTASAHAVTVSGNLKCGNAYFGCQSASLSCPGYSQTTTPDSYTGAYRFTGVPHNQTCTLRAGYFGLYANQCCSKSISVPDSNVTASYHCMRGSC